MFCRHCRSLMNKTMRFENGTNYYLYKCPNCYYETKPKLLFFKARRNNLEKYPNKQIKKYNKKRGK